MFMLMNNTFRVGASDVAQGKHGINMLQVSKKCILRNKSSLPIASQWRVSFCLVEHTVKTDL